MSGILIISYVPFSGEWKYRVIKVSKLFAIPTILVVMLLGRISFVAIWPWALILVGICLIAYIISQVITEWEENIITLVFTIGMMLNHLWIEWPFDLQLVVFLLVVGTAKWKLTSNDIDNKHYIKWPLYMTVVLLPKYLLYIGGDYEN